MPQISNLSFNVSFEPHNPNRVGLTNTTASLPAGFVGIFKVTQPDGYVRNGDINTPDVTNVVSSCVVTLVPDSAGQLQQGQYIIEFIGNAPGYLSTSFIRTFTLQYTAATISLRNDFDIFTPQLAYTDISNYSVSGWTISSGPTRKWDATSPTTGTISGTNSSIDIRYNNQYYAENYTIQFEVNVAYASQAYPWLTITHTRTQTTSVTACIPKSLEDLTQAVEALREESNASCGGDWAKFEKANALYAHLLNMLRLVLIAGQYQDGFFDVYQQLLTYIQNGSVACTTIGQVIPPYDFSDYESSIYDGQSSYCQLVGDGVNTTYRVNHQLGDTCVVVQVYEVATGKQVFCDLAVSTINSIDITFYEPPTLNQYRVVAVAGALGLRGQGFQPGGLTGQILRKKTNADFDTEWADVTVALPLLVPYTGATQSVYLGEHGVEAGFVRFDTTPTTTPATAAVMSWNDTDGTAELRLKGNNVTLQVGQEMVARVVNKTGANLLGSQYKAVRVRKVSEGGAQGQRLAVVLAQANTEFLSTDMLGIVTENISNNQEGFITTFGAVKNIDTTGALQGEVWADGDILFLSPTVAGGLTKVKPSAPNYLSIVGYVEYAHQNNGKIFVHVQTSWELDELHNVSITNPVNNQVLKYNGTLWVNSTIPAVTSVGLATATSGVTITDTPVTSSGVININIATAAAVQSGLLSASDWATFNAKQSAITLTTTGNSGAATFVGSTLNIPNYTLAGLGGVPSTRSLTINGTAYDLSADRVWSVGTVTSVAALTIGTAGTDITSTVATGTTTPVITLNIPTASAANRGALSASDWAAFNAKVGGSGTTNRISKFTAASTIGNSLLSDDGVELKYTGADGATIQGTTSGFLSLYGTSDNYIQFKDAAGTAGRIQYNHTSDYMSFNTASTERLRITSGGNVGIGTTSPNGKLDVANAGDVAIWATATSAGSAALYLYPIGGGVAQIASVGAVPLQMLTNGSERMRIFANGRVGVNTTTDAGYQFDVNGTGRFAGTLYTRSGTAVGIEMASTSAIRNSGTQYFDYGTGGSGDFYFRGGSGFANVLTLMNGGNVGIGMASPASILNVRASSATFTIDDSGDGTSKISFRPSAASYAERAFLSVDYGTAEMRIAAGASGGAYFQSFYTNAAERLRISSTGVITVANLAGSGTRLVVADASGNLSATTVSSSIVSGSGTTNYVPKFTAASTIGNSQIFDNGTRVGVNTATPDINTILHTARGSNGTVATFGIQGLTINPRIRIDASETNNTVSFNTNYNGGTSPAITFLTSEVERLRITSGGNVGIGTGSASPVTKLHISQSNSGNYASVILLSNSADAAADRTGIYGSASPGAAAPYRGGITFHPGASGAMSFHTGNNNSPADGVRMYIQSNGNIGVNTTTDAGYQLDVNGTFRTTGSAASQMVVNTTNASGTALIHSQSGSTVGWVGNGANSVIGGSTSDYGINSQASLFLATGGYRQATVTLAGDMGIGTSSPSYKLDINGTLRSVNGANFATNGTSHIGMGTVPSAWSWPNGVTQFRFGGHIAVADNSFLQLGTNSFYDGSNYVRVNAGYSSRYLQNDGSHFWSTAITSTAGSTVTFNEQMRMTRDGELLINTTSDAGDYKLQVAGNIYTSGLAKINDLIINLNSPFVTGANVYTNGQSLAIGTQGANLMSFFTNNAERGRINSAGEFLINTTTDAGDYKLQVAGNIYTTGNIQMTGSAAIRNTVSQFIDYGTGGSGDLYIRGGSGFANVMTLTNGGNVGIGTQSPTQALSIARGAGLIGGISLRGNGNDAANEFFVGQGSAGIAFLAQRANTDLSISTNNTTRLYIFANGRVFVGASPTDAGYQLDVNGNTRISGKIDISANDSFGLNIVRPGTSAIAAQIYNNGGANGWMIYGVESSAGGVIFPGTTAYASVFGSFRNVPIQFATNNTVRMTIDGGGSVGIGVASPSASAILQVDSTTKGMLPPRMTTTQRDAITSPATGLIVYDTTVNKLSVYNGTTWKYAQYE